MKHTACPPRSFSLVGSLVGSLAGSLLGAALLFAGCATLGGARGGGGSASGAQLTERNTALEQLAAEAMKPCASKGTATDRGIFVVTAKPDGSISVGPAQWLGSPEVKQCLDTEIPKAKLPAWTGPTVSWLWNIGTKENPAPRPLPEMPADYDQKQQDYVRRTQGSGNDTSVGPLSACAMTSIGQEAYGVVKVRLFIYPDGKVAGATPIGNDAEGKDAGFTDCVVNLTREWTFPAFPGPAFTSLDVTLRFGVPPESRSGH